MPLTPFYAIAAGPGKKSSRGHRLPGEEEEEEEGCNAFHTRPRPPPPPRNPTLPGEQLRPLPAPWHPPEPGASTTALPAERPGGKTRRGGGVARADPLPRHPRHKAVGGCQALLSKLRHGDVPGCQSLGQNVTQQRHLATVSPARGHASLPSCADFTKLRAAPS